MQHIIERNERNARRSALVLAIGLHLALGGLLYIQMSETSSTPPTTKVNSAKLPTTPTAKTVSLQP